MSKARGRTEERKRVSHRRIVAAAGTLFRRNGIRGTSVQRVMADAGMTVGGFYAHFASKVDLVRRVVLETLRERRRMLRLRIGRRRGRSFVQELLAIYLSSEHRDQPQLGCPVAALLSDFERDTPYLREDLEREFETMIASLERHLSAVARAEAALGGQADATAEAANRPAAAHAEPPAAGQDEAPAGGSEAPGDPTPRDRAIAILALSFGGLQMARTVRGSEQSEEVLAACRRVGTALAPLSGKRDGGTA